MARTVLGVIAGFFAWFLVWLGAEQILSAVSPAGFGAHQAAFQAAIENGGEFTANTTLLLIQLVLGSVASVLAGFLAAVIAMDNIRAPRALGILLLAFGLLKVVLSWPYVPLWHHVIFLVLLFPMTIMGGRLRRSS